MIQALFYKKAGEGVSWWIILFALALLFLISALVFPLLVKNTAEKIAGTPNFKQSGIIVDQIPEHLDEEVVAPGTTFSIETIEPVNPSFTPAIFVKGDAGRGWDVIFSYPCEHEQILYDQGITVKVPSICKKEEEHEQLAYLLKSPYARGKITLDDKQYFYDSKMKQWYFDANENDLTDPGELLSEEELAAAITKHFYIEELQNS